MADITICINKECPLNHSCYRYNAKWDDHAQSVCKFEPIIDEDSYDVECNMYLKPHPTKKRV